MTAWNHMKWSTLSRMTFLRCHTSTLAQVSKTGKILVSPQNTSGLCHRITPPGGVFRRVVFRCQCYCQEENSFSAEAMEGAVFWLLNCTSLHILSSLPWPWERSRLQPWERGFIDFHEVKWFALIISALCRPLPRPTRRERGLDLNSRSEKDLKTARSRWGRRLPWESYSRP
jgi:hypothetical protein